MNHVFTRAIALATAASLGLSAHAQSNAPTGTSKPQALAIVDTIPAARDVAYPGTIRLTVDATDIQQGIFKVRETIPVSAGPLTLLYPKWLPGNHSPSGTIEKVAGLAITANGKTLRWRRDTVDVFAFHVDIPAGVRTIEVAFQFLSATTGAMGRIVMTPEMLNLQWVSNALYPAGHYMRRIMIQPTAIYPDGWTAATALRVDPAAPRGPGNSITYQPVAFDTLGDSPVFAGKYSRIEKLSPDVTFNIFADKPDQLKASPTQIAAHRAIVDQIVKLYGAQHYDHYDYLFALSDKLGGIGLEHHRSSENGSAPSYFTEWDSTPSARTLLTHEFNHSWDGKFRRGADLWTPDYRTPMQGSLLWVYEGQDQFWGEVLAARAGLVSQQEALDSLAMAAAQYEEQNGRTWRPMVDTTNDPTIAQRRAQTYPSFQRSEDYYVEGQLIWLDADSLIRERSGGKRSLDDFARAFFGVRDRDWGELTYTFDDVIATLNQVEPYDWSKFLHDRVDEIRLHAPLDGLARGGYKLVYTDTPSGWWKSREKLQRNTNLKYSLGLAVDSGGVASVIVWDGPAFNAGITGGTTIVAVDGQGFTPDSLKAAIAAKKPFSLLIKQADHFRTVEIKYDGGLRYPHLERTTKGPSSLDALYAPLK